MESIVITEIPYKEMSRSALVENVKYTLYFVSRFLKKVQKGKLCFIRDKEMFDIKNSRDTVLKHEGKFEWNVISLKKIQDI